MRIIEQGGWQKRCPSCSTLFEYTSEDVYEKYLPGQDTLPWETGLEDSVDCPVCRTCLRHYG